MLKILHCVEFYHPHIGGAEKHVQFISEHLAQGKNDVTIVTTKLNRGFKNYNGCKIKEFDIRGNAIQGYSGSITDYQNFLINSNFDIILFYAAHQWTFDLAIEILKDIRAKKIFLPCGFSKINNLLYFPYFKILQKKINIFNKVICLSSTYQDFKFCKLHFKKKLM